MSATGSSPTMSGSQFNLSIYGKLKTKKMDREEAIKNVRSFIGQLTEDCQESIRTLIPELAESEDERMLEAAICHVVTSTDFVAHGIQKDDLLSWLRKKQKEQRSADLFNDSRYLEGFDTGREVQKVFDEPINPFDTKLFQDGVKEGLRLAKEDMKWTNEEESAFNRAIDNLEYEGYKGAAADLKYIRDKVHWRPTQKQIDAISEVMSLNPSADLTTTLGTLYCELKKLKED